MEPDEKKTMIHDIALQVFVISIAIVPQTHASSKRKAISSKARNSSRKPEDPKTPLSQSPSQTLTSP
ncbi:hypothetical protein LR48_Vigan05g054200 [Vigna angularis]|uniref:Uncharacterized protein n=1 Tax=Phaseolus angularis TaxID=3914 RepID=A0A0L9UJM2_PHAAN|nr:hypothetical protein LR48_Vigan05g054200 [Vigna angularis]